MEKTIHISGIDVPFKATAGTIRRYRAKFQKDLILDMQELSRQANSGMELTADALLTFENVAYIMAKQADPSIPDDPDEWLDRFEMFSIYRVLPELVTLWGLSVHTLEESKKK